MRRFMAVPLAFTLRFFMVRSLSELGPSLTQYEGSAFIYLRRVCLSSLLHFVLLQRAAIRSHLEFPFASSLLDRAG